MKIDINDILKLLNNIIEEYRECTIKNENMVLDIRINEKDIEKLEIFVYELEHNIYCKRLIDINLQLLQNNIKYDEGDKNE